MIKFIVTALVCLFPNIVLACSPITTDQWTRLRFEYARSFQGHVVEIDDQEQYIRAKFHVTNTFSGSIQDTIFVYEQKGNHLQSICPCGSDFLRSAYRTNNKVEIHTNAADEQLIVCRWFNAHFVNDLPDIKEPTSLSRLVSNINDKYCMFISGGDRRFEALGNKIEPLQDFDRIYRENMLEESEIHLNKIDEKLCGVAEIAKIGYRLKTDLIIIHGLPVIRNNWVNFTAIDLKNGPFTIFLVLADGQVRNLGVGNEQNYSVTVINRNVESLEKNSAKPAFIVLLSAISVNAIEEYNHIRSVNDLASYIYKSPEFAAGKVWVGVKGIVLTTN